MDGSFLTLIRKRFFQYHMFLLPWRILFFSRMDLLAVTYYFLSTVTKKDLFCVPERFLFCHILFFIHCHKKKIFLSLKKDLSAVTYYFLSSVTRKDFYCLVERSFYCHISFFYPRVTGVSGVHISEKIHNIFPALWASPGFI